MSFNSVIGQKRVKNILQGALQRDTLASSYLFFGPPGVGKMAMALELARAVNCSSDASRPCDQCSPCRRIVELKYPDVTVIYPMPKDIKDEDRLETLQHLVTNPYHAPEFAKNAEIYIEDIRHLRKEAAYKPFEGRKKVFILAQAHKLKDKAANALLKTLEEPPGHVLLILSTPRPGELPDTILSRCQQIRFSRLGEAQLVKALEKTSSADPDQLRLASRLAQGSLDRAMTLLEEDIDQRRSTALGFLTRILTGDLLTVIKSAEKIGRNRQRDVSAQHLEALQIWFRDLLLFLEGDEKHLVNSDMKSNLAGLARQFDWAGAQECLGELDSARRAMAVNVNMELLWMVLFIRFRTYRKV